MRLLRSRLLRFGKYVLNKYTKSTSTAQFTPNVYKSFKGILDVFNGVTVSSEEENCKFEEFPGKLQESLKKWFVEKRRGIWFKVSNYANWIPELAKNGFKFHHVLDDFVVMYKWLPTREPCKIPSYAHTILGVGGVVINKKNQILVISEKFHRKPHWKLPGGYVDPGENFVNAAIREVHEETNILTEYEALLSVRHAYIGMYGCSDLYALVALKPLSNVIKKLNSEIAACKWMDIDEYMKHPYVYGLNKLLISIYLKHKRNDVNIYWYEPIFE